MAALYPDLYQAVNHCANASITVFAPDFLFVYTFLHHIIFAPSEFVANLIFRAVGLVYKLIKKVI